MSRKDFEANHVKIKEAYLELLNQNHKAPTYTEIAKQTGLHRKTIENHAKEINFEEIQSRIKLLAEEVLVGLAKAGMNGNSDAARVFFQFGMDFAEKMDVTSGGKPIDQKQVIKLGEGQEIEF